LDDREPLIGYYLKSALSAIVSPTEPYLSERTAPEATSIYGLVAFPDKKPEWKPPIL
tara:strand:+ start:920 stop:1090 length:171 start_codon:yes stop_codon:yes gene_type:complete